MYAIQITIKVKRTSEIVGLGKTVRWTRFQNTHGPGKRPVARILHQTFSNSVLMQKLKCQDKKNSLCCFLQHKKRNSLYAIDSA